MPEKERVENGGKVFIVFVEELNPTEYMFICNELPPNHLQVG